MGQYATIDRRSSELFQALRKSSFGDYIAVSALDGIERLVSFGKIEDLPLIAVVSSSRSDIDSLWLPRARIMALILALAAITVVILLISVQLELRRRHRAETLANESESKYRLIADHSSDAIVFRDKIGNSVFRSPAYYKMFGITDEPLHDLSLRQLLEPESRDVRSQTSAKIAGGANLVEDLLCCRRSDGRRIWVERASSAMRNDSGDLLGIISNLRDVTRRKEAEDKVTQYVSKLSLEIDTDSLTGLANRRAFDKALEKRIAEVRHHGKALALLLLDLDFFKRLNDSFGHLAGDEALRQVADCIATSVHRPGDLAARLGGEEFAIILHDTGTAGALHVAETIRRNVEALEIENGMSSTLTVSIGCASAQSGKTDHVGEIFDTADKALYQAKAAGRNCVKTSGFEMLLQCLE